MRSILLFAGTTEGRRIAEGCRNQPVSVYVSVATQYGESIIDPAENLHILHGRRDEKQLAALLDDTGAELVIDATHPYADQITAALQTLCRERGMKYLRVVRDEARAGTEGCVYVDDTAAAVEYLNTVSGKVLLTVGSKALEQYTGVRDWQERLYARLLPLPEALENALSLGFPGAHLICMQGPFSQAMNAALLRDLRIRYLVTKDTGTAGGFPEKISAAQSCGVTTVVIRRPLQEKGVSEAECLRLLRERFAFRGEKKVTILGIGPGDAEAMTLAAVSACREAELIVGAKRVCEALSRFQKPVVHAVIPAEIEDILRSSQAQRIVVAMSGDTGFYSGARGLLQRISDLRPTVLPGISSVSALCSRTGTCWEDAVLVSAHGRACNLVGKVRTSPKVIALTGGQVPALLEELTGYGLGEVEVTVGENLSYPDERITAGTAAELRKRNFDPLSVLLIQNPRAGEEIVTHGHPDSDFVRTDVPMTKQEVRAVTLSKLRLRRDSLCWDVGAGTGSVALEMGERCQEGHVWAVERREDACELIEENKRKLRIANVTVVHAAAPDALDSLPAPTHVFVGGSGGSLTAILTKALEQNPAVRIVINAVTVETLAEAAQAMETLPVRETEIVQLTVARSRRLGSHHLLTGMNPVFLLSCQGGGGHE